MRARLLLTLLSVTLTSCQDLPTREWERLSELRGRLLKGDAAPYATEEVARFEEDFSQLREAYFKASNQFSFLRSSDLPLDISRSVDWAEFLLRHIDLRKSFLSKAQEAELKTISEELSGIRNQRLKKESRELLTVAEVQLATTLEKWQKGEFLEAASRIETLLETYTVLEDRVHSTRQRFADPVLLRMWDEWLDRSIRKSIEDGGQLLVVVKASYRAILYRRGVPVREFPIELGWNWIDDKKMQGDGATPEGEYRVVLKKGPGKTKYHRALLLDYPNARDHNLFRLAKEAGEIDPNTGIGALIEIHGGGGTGRNWTDGCVALANPDMEELFDLAQTGMPVTIIGANSK